MYPEIPLCSTRERAGGSIDLSEVSPLRTRFLTPLATAGTPTREWTSFFFCPRLAMWFLRGRRVPLSCNSSVTPSVSRRSGAERALEFSADFLLIFLSSIPRPRRADLDTPCSGCSWVIRGWTHVSCVYSRKFRRVILGPKGVSLARQASGQQRATRSHACNVTTPMLRSLTDPITRAS